ncbi:MAG: hypothetical protein ACK5L4_14915 [Pseudanabaena sp.]
MEGNLMIGKKTSVLAVLLATLFGGQFAGDGAWAGGGDTTTNNVVAAPTESTVLQSVPNGVANASALSTSPISLQQTGINNFASVGAAAIPNCGGICIYTNVRSISANGGGLGASQTEISAGLIWQVSSPEQSNMEIQGRLAGANIDKIGDEQKDMWMKKLIEALNGKDVHGARGWAILLAPKLGKTADQLLRDMRL